MAEIIVELTEQVRKDYRRLPDHVKAKFKRQLRFLVANPRHPSLRVHPIRGSDGYEEFYVDDRYRCVFRRDGHVYRLLAVGTHKIVDRFGRK
jgi:mRNA-degrading endonuclease RelE of RelBE toxin-antitoxin system